MRTNDGSEKTNKRLAGIIERFRRRPIPVLVSLAAALIIAATAAGGSGRKAGGFVDIQRFEAGKVAERDVIADRAVSYIDEEGTRLRMDYLERQTYAVFRHSAAAADEIKSSWKRFSGLADTIVQSGGSAQTYRLEIQKEYPSQFSVSVLDDYFSAPDRDLFWDYGLQVLDVLADRGIFAIDRGQLVNFNRDIAELWRGAGSREQRYYINVITLTDVPQTIRNITNSMDMPDSFKRIAVEILEPFVVENVFFSLEDSTQQAIAARERADPVYKYVAKGEPIVRKGFIVTEEDMLALEALHKSLGRNDLRTPISMIMIVCLLYLLFIFLRSEMFLGKSLRQSEVILLSVLACVYIAGTMLVRNFAPLPENFLLALALPTALFVMIPAVFMGYRMALVFALALPLGVFVCDGFDILSYIFALVSGVAAAVVVKNAEKRMDLIKAGLIIAAANSIAVIVILLRSHAGPGLYPPTLFWAMLNGIMSGILILGFLPPLEAMLNSATAFRLIELSDLNAPILKKLFTTAPGTYSHSVMVANLAEQACQDIGANALLARVGAYYHDLGKMENPDYFVENQTNYNRHDDMAPRLSATVIRSHVKLGVEKARSLNLPLEVIDIIAEHHGNSLISWFYNKASQQETQVSVEDFSYPGVPPRSRESAVVMLADVTEAAVRTLSKPNAAKIERFIQGLFDDKVKTGQLADSELTFRELEIIKKAYVKVLAGYYHSRIEYPNQVSEKDENAGLQPQTPPAPEKPEGSE